MTANPAPRFLKKRSRWHWTIAIHFVVLALVAPFIWREMVAPQVPARTEVVGTYVATDDSKINQQSATTNYGSDGTEELQRSSGGNSRRVLVKFDISDIPSGALIEEALLVMSQSGSGSGLSGVQQSVHRITRSWVEGQVTWNNADTSTNWTTAGGDFVGTATATFTPSSGGSNGAVRSFDVTADVAAFVAGSQTNYGWLLKFTTDTSGSGLTQTFHSSESATSGFRPQLVVTYTEVNPPTVDIVNFEQRRDGSNLVDVTVDVTDEDTDDLMMRVFSTIGTCVGDLNQLTIGSIEDVGTADSGGVPDITPANYYQIGSTSNRRIVTTGGSNSIQFTWEAGTDEPDTDTTSISVVDEENYCFGVGVNDGSSSVTSTLVVGFDTLEPTAPTGPNAAFVSTDSVTFSGWGVGCDSVDSNFYEYKMHYTTEMGGTNVETPAWTSSTHPGFAESGCGDVGGGTIFDGLQSGTTYYTRLFAYDSFGHVATAAQELSFTTELEPPSTPTAVVSSTNATALTFIIDPGSNGDGVEYNICRAMSGVPDVCETDSFVQADGTLGAPIVWQTYEQWGAAGGITISNLSQNTQYRFLVRARDDTDGQNTTFSLPSEPVFTLAGPIASVDTIADATVTTTLGIRLAWTNSIQSGLRIERDNSCNGTYDVTIFDATGSNGVSPTTTIANLTAGTCYRFRFSSYNGAGVLNTTSRLVSSDITLPPGQPQNVTAATTQTDSISWSWTGVTGAEFYDVYTPDETLLSTVSTPQYDQGDLSPNTEYEIMVRARSANGAGIASTAASSYTETAIPTGVSHTNQTTESIRWTWTGGGQPEFYAADANNGANNSGWIADTYWDMSGLSPNTAYTINVRARNDAEEETSSASITRYTSQAEPGEVQFTSVSQTSVTVVISGGFTNIGTGDAAVVISNNAGDTQEVTDGSSSWANSGLTPSTQYTYTAYATNSDGDQTASVVGSIYTYAAVPGAPMVAVVSPTSLDIQLNRNGNPLGTDVVIRDEVTAGQYVDKETDTLTGSNEPDEFDTFANWGTVRLTGLTPNTAYRFSTAAKNGDGVLSAGSAASVSVYTLANPPANPIATPDSTTQITLNWGRNSNPDGTVFYAENSTAGTNSGWVTDRTWTSANLTCGTHTFRVKARNAEGVETDWETTTVDLAGCATTSGGGGTGVPLQLTVPPRPPSQTELGGGFRVAINGGDTFTSTRDVRLSLRAGDDTAKMSIANDALFTGASIETFSTSRLWTLPPGYGGKTVFAKFFTAAGAASQAVSSSIIFVPSLTAHSPVITSPTPGSRMLELPFDVTGQSIPGYTVSLQVASSTYDVAVSDAGTFQITVLDQLLPGAYPLTVVATDPTGLHREETAITVHYGETLAVLPEPVVSEPTQVPPTEEPVTLSTDVRPTRPKSTSVSSPPAASTVEDVEKDITAAVETKKAFLFVRQPSTVGFEQSQVGPVVLAGAQSVDVIVRPKTPVRSVVAHLYRMGGQESVGRVSFWQRAWAQLVPRVVAATNGEEPVASFVVPYDTNLNVYRSALQFPGLTKGEYRLELVFNNEDGTKTTFSKPVTSLGQGTIRRSDGTSVKRARVTVYHEREVGSYEVWKSDRFGERNPVLTDNEGKYALSLPPGHYYFTVDAPGIALYQSRVYVVTRPTPIVDDITVDIKKHDALFRFVSRIVDWFSTFFSAVIGRIK